MGNNVCGVAKKNVSIALIFFDGGLVVVWECFFTIV